uniref:Tetraspanin n=1 Tax=Tabanus bromius TaxID=304241 RepID=A0A0K8TP69_TABBR
MSCGISVIKYILFLVNIICAIAGIALIALGAVVITQAKHLQGADVKGINVVAGFIIGLGCLIFIIAFFGCCGAIRESHCMTMTYAIVLLILLIAEIAVIAYVFISNTKGGEIFDDLWKNRDKPEIQASINAIQSFVGCCGRDSPLDYGLSLPKSCCPESENVFSCVVASAKQNGCHHAFEDFIKKNFKLLGFVGIGVAVFEAVAFIFACTLANHVRNNERRSHY